MTTYYSLLQQKMEEQRLNANARFKLGDYSSAVELYMKASELYETYNTKPNDESLATATSNHNVSIASVASPATIRSALLEELTKSVGNACTSLYKLSRFEECATISKRKGIDRNPYFAKGHAFVGMSNINLISNHLKNTQVSLTLEQCILATQRLHEAVQRLFIALLVLPAMASQVKVSLAEGLRLIRDLQAIETASTPRASNDNDSSSTSSLQNEDLIEVTKNTGGNGNGVVAKKPIAAGQLLARLTNPFSVASYEGFHKHICVSCGIPIVSEAFKEMEEGNVNGSLSQNVGESAPTAKPKTTTTTTTTKRGCEACQMVRYCSETCQNRYHIPRHLLHECAYMLKLKVMCENIAERELDVPDEFAELAAHAITTLSGLLVLKSSPAAFFDPTNKALLAQESDTNKNSDDTGKGTDKTSLLDIAHTIRKSVLSLESHSVEVAQSMHPTLPLVCEMLSVDGFGDRGAVRSLCEGVSKGGNNNSLPELDEHLVATLLGIVRCNAMEIADPSGLGVAQGLFAVPVPYLSLFSSTSADVSQPANIVFSSNTVPLSACHFNHSCDPNAMFDIKSQEIRTIAPVPSGSEITISYIPQLYWPANLRREGLAERFYFTCTCDRCSPYRRGAVEKEQKLGSQEASPMSDTLKLLKITTNDWEVSTIYDKISSAEKPAAASERPGATKYYYNNMLGVCGGIRQRPVEEIIAAHTQTTIETEAQDGTVTAREIATPSPTASSAVSSSSNAFVNEVKTLYAQCNAHLEPWHFVLHDVHNTQTFLYSVLGDQTGALVSSMEELLTFEACVYGGVPAKVDKLKNIAACVDAIRANLSSQANGSHSACTDDTLSLHISQNILGTQCTSPHKEVLVMLWEHRREILDVLLSIHDKSLLA